MKVLFLTQYPRQGPSSRYRVYQLLPWLRENDVDCDVRSLIAEEDYDWVRRKGHVVSKSFLMCRSWVSRLIQTIRSGHYDLVYILKTAFPIGPPIFETILSKNSTPFVVDYDDAIYLQQESVDHRFLDGLKSTHYFNKVLQMADGVIVPNEFLRRHSEKLNRNVFLVPEAEDTERLVPRPSHSNNGSLIVGWVGSPSTAQYLDLIAPSLQRLCKNFPQVKCRFIGGQWSKEGVRTEFVPWSMEKETENLQSLDIGLMPLTDTDWSRGKSGCKLRQYMSVGVPGVASRVGYNCELIQSADHGLLVDNDQDAWYSALSNLVLNPDFRNKIAIAARTRVENEFAIEKVGPVLKDALSSFAGRGK